MKKQQLKASISAAVLGVLSPLAMALPASAASITWSGFGEAVNTDSADAVNWVGGVVPASASDILVFPASGNWQEVNLDGNFSELPVDAETPGALELAGILFNGDWEGSDTSDKNYHIIYMSGINDVQHVIKLSGDIESVMGGVGGTQSVATSVTLEDDVAFKTEGSNTLSVGDDGTTLDLNGKTLTLDASGGTISLLGNVTGEGMLDASGKVKLMLKAAEGAGFSVNVPSGELAVDDDLGANVTINGGTLKGTGTVGSVTMESGAIAPGASPGVLSTGNLTFNDGTHEVELGGKESGQFDQLNVTGSVKLGDGTTALDISLFGGFAPAVNDSFVIINNDGEDAVEGHFEGLEDGDKVTLGDYTYQINYDAGSGNDVVLLVTGTPSVPDTGSESLLGNPVATLGAALMVAGTIAGYRVYEFKKARK